MTRGREMANSWIVAIGECISVLEFDLVFHHSKIADGFMKTAQEI